MTATRRGATMTSGTMGFARGWGGRAMAVLLLAGLVVGGAAPAAVADDHAHDEHGHDDHADDEHGRETHGAEGGAASVATLERFGVRVATAGPGEVDVGIDLPGEVR